MSAVTRLKKELLEMTNNPPDGCYAGLANDSLFHWKCTILGPKDTVYESGIFSIAIKFQYNYPYSPPKVRFETRIYHCNISKSSGSICMDVLKNKWSPAWTVSKLLMGIRMLLEKCNPYDPLEYSIATLYLGNKYEHDRKAKEFTRRFANT